MDQKRIISPVKSEIVDDGRFDEEDLKYLKNKTMDDDGMYDKTFGKDQKKVSFVEDDNHFRKDNK